MKRFVDYIKNLKNLGKISKDSDISIKETEIKDKKKGREIDIEEIKIKKHEKEEGELRKFGRNFWNLLWKDDSLKGWIFSVIFIFIFIKFLFLPFLSLVTGTALPLAIVESCSMYHDGNILTNYDDWWDSHEDKYSQFNIDKNDFSNFKISNGFNKGDILFITGVNPEKIKVGNIIIFSTGSGNPIIHRIMNIENQGGEIIFSTIGDNNNGQLSVEKNIHESQIVGKASGRIAPYLGWVKLIFFESQKSSSERGFCTGR